MLSPLTPTFDLVAEPWLPVVVAGHRTHLSLREALVRAHEVDALALDEPLSMVATLRQVLMPVVLRVLGAPRSGEAWQEVWDAGHLDPAAINTYLSHWRERFDLFSPSMPFAQVGRLEAVTGETKSVAVIISALAAGNNVPLFSSRTDDDPPPLRPAEAVGRLLAAHAYDTAAIKSGAKNDDAVRASKTTGNPTGPLGQLGAVIPWGRTLYQTLVLNLPIIPAGLRPDDRPQWERDPATARWEVRPAAGVLDLLTWQARRIRMFPEVEPDGQVVVRRVVLAAGDRLAALEPDLEPHTAWRQVPNPQAGQSPTRPVCHRPGRRAWQGLESLVAADPNAALGTTAPALLAQLADVLPQTYPLQVVTVGLAYGNQSAVVEDLMVDALPLPVLALVADDEGHRVAVRIARDAEGLRRAADHLVDDLRTAAGGGKVPPDKGEHLGQVLLQSLTPVVRRLLSDLQRDPFATDAIEDRWRATARRLAMSVTGPVLDSVPATAFLGREVKPGHSAKGDKKTFVMTAAGAEMRFRAELNDLLGPADPALPCTTHAAPTEAPA